MSQKKINKPQLAVELRLYVTPCSDGKMKASATLKHHCRDKDVAIDLIKNYIEHNIRKIDA